MVNSPVEIIRRSGHIHVTGFYGLPSAPHTRPTLLRLVKAVSFVYLYMYMYIYIYVFI